jgi:hypothetical protein
LLVAAGGKAVTGASFDGLLHDLGIPRRVVHFVEPAIVPLELGVGIALALGLSPLLSGLGAVVFGSSFVVVQTMALRGAGQTPCNCFGATSAVPASWLSLLRAIVFLCVAIAALAFGASTPIWQQSMPTTAWSVVGLLVAISLLAVLALLEEVKHFEERRPRPLKHLAGSA